MFYLVEDGTVYDDSYRKVGRIEDDGTVYDDYQGGEKGGRVAGERWAGV